MLRGSETKFWKQKIVIISIVGFLAILAAIFIPLCIFVFFKSQSSVEGASKS